MREKLPKRNEKGTKFKSLATANSGVLKISGLAVGGGAGERGSAHFCEHEGARGVAAMEIGDPRVASVREGGERAAEAVARGRRFGGDDDDDDDAGGVDVGAG